MPTEAELINQDFVEALLTMRATIYSRATTGPTKGQFTVVEHSGLACLLDQVSANSATSVADRAALASQRVFRYDATYSLPESGVQIEVDVFSGKRWNPQGGTDAPDYPPGIGIIGKTVLVVRA